MRLKTTAWLGIITLMMFMILVFVPSRASSVEVPIPLPGPVETIIREVPVPGPVQTIIDRVEVPGPVETVFVPRPGPTVTVTERVPVPGPTVTVTEPSDGRTVTIFVTPSPTPTPPVGQTAQPRATVSPVPQLIPGPPKIMAGDEEDEVLTVTEVVGIGTAALIGGIALGIAATFLAYISGRKDEERTQDKMWEQFRNDIFRR